MRKSLLHFIALSMIFMLFSFSHVVAQNNEGDSLLMFIHSASTYQEHIKLAEYFENQSTKMEGESNSHLTMAELYKKVKINSESYEHCMNLSRGFEVAAAEYRSIALLHRIMAEDAKEKASKQSEGKGLSFPFR